MAVHPSFQSDLVALLQQTQGMRYMPAITTVSLGQSSRYTIQEKLYAASRHGIHGVELFYDDLESLARSHSISEQHCSSREELLNAAREVRSLCDALHIRVLNLQPIRFYEGLVDRRERDRILCEEIPVWMDIVSVLGGDTILVASNFLPPEPHTGEARTVGDLDTIVDDLRMLALLGEIHSPPVKFAYEAIAWATHVDTWEKSWDIVQRVNRPNFGIAIDTFNVAARVFADPAAIDGRRNGAQADADLHHSLHRLETTVDVSKLFVVQVADGERLAEPLRVGHPFYVEGQPTRMSWSRNARLFLCEEERGGYLPVLEVLQTVLRMGWSGWVAYEIFSRTLAGPDPDTPAIHAARASRSWARVAAALGLYRDLDIAPGLDKQAVQFQSTPSGEMTA